MVKTLDERQVMNMVASALLYVWSNPDITPRIMHASFKTLDDAYMTMWNRGIRPLPPTWTTVNTLKEGV